MTGRILGVDPGRARCGIAVIDSAGVILRRIVAAERLRDETVDIIAEVKGVEAIAVGNGTSMSIARRALGNLGIPIVEVDERNTTLHARARYYEAFPPRGWRRFIPRGLLRPTESLDDWAAVLIAERYRDRERMREALLGP